VAKVDRHLYISPGVVDRDKMTNYARERAQAGEVVVLHQHEQAKACEDNCSLLYLVVTAELWQGDLERSDYFLANKR